MLGVIVPQNAKLKKKLENVRNVLETLCQHADITITGNRYGYLVVYDSDGMELFNCSEISPKGVQQIEIGSKYSDV